LRIRRIEDKVEGRAICIERMEATSFAWVKIPWYGTFPANYLREMEFYLIGKTSLGQTYAAWVLGNLFSGALIGLFLSSLSTITLKPPPI